MVPMASIISGISRGAVRADTDAGPGRSSTGTQSMTVVSSAPSGAAARGSCAEATSHSTGMAARNGTPSTFGNSPSNSSPIGTKSSTGTAR